MAKFNEILSGRFNRGLQKVFQMKGGPPSAQLASEIMPVWMIYHGTEDRVLDDWLRFAGQATSVATAGVAAGCRLRNPLNSNVIAVIELLSFFTRNLASDEVTVDIRFDNPTDLSVPNASGPGPLDPRPWTGSPQLTAGGSGLSPLKLSGSAAVFTTNFPFLKFAAPTIFTSVNVIYTPDQELLLLPGMAITLFLGTLNSSHTVSFVWRQRALEDSEVKV